jgi:glycosyltransferase involved in cell wall biosynthesis
MISGDRSIASGRASAFTSMLPEFSTHFERIDIVCPKSPVRHSGSVVIPANVFVHPSPYPLLLQPLWILQKGREILRNRSSNTVMTVHEYPPFYNGIGARLLRLFFSIPTSIEIHHLVGFPHPASVVEWIGAKLTRWFLPFHAKSFDAVRVVNSTVRNQLIEWGVSHQKIHLVPSFYLDSSLCFPQSDVVKKYDIVFSARLVENKGLLFLLDLLSKFPEKNCLITGDGPMKAHAQKKALDLGIANRVTFTGWLASESAVYDAMRSARLFVMLSSSEGGPRSALEAMACGVPVFATRVGVMPDVITHGVNGWLVSGDFEETLCVLHEALADDERLALMGKEAARIAERFEKKAALRSYAEFLQFTLFPL